MSDKRILLTAFCGTSAEVLIKRKNVKEQYEILVLPNDKVKDSELLIEALQQEHFDYVISLGQRPNIKDKVHIETTARRGEACLDTAFDCVGLKRVFERYGLVSKLSHSAGTSFCNELYWNGLQYIAQNNLETKMVFVHVPFEKNIAELDVFRNKLVAGIRDILKKEDR